MNLFLSLMCVLSLIVTAIHAIYKVGSDRDERATAMRGVKTSMVREMLEAERRAKKRRRLRSLAVILALACAGSCLFLFFSDTAKLMALMNYGTIAHAVIFAGVCVAMAFAFSNKQARYVDYQKRQRS
jgi:peptidoglycan/LPS O-acetylase OafA/YrhL